MAGDERWYFTKEQLLSPQTNPTQKCGIDADKELSYRQQAANFIQDMGQRLKVTQLCINTAIVYMHRFYMFHSFSKFHRNAISSCALFLAAKVEEQPRKLEHVINVAHKCLHRDAPALDTKSEAYLEQAHELVVNENIMLQTLGFDIAIEHPHTYVVKCCQLVRASKDLAQTSYFMATNSLHLTTMCLQYRPTFVACVCIHLACKWSSWEIPKSSEGKEWFWYVDKSVTSELLEELTSEFLAILDKCPSKLKRKMSLAKELLPEEKKTKVGTSQPSCKEVIKQNHVNSQQSSKSHQPKLSSSKKQIKKSPGQPSVNGKENPDHSFHLEVTSIPTLSSSPSENISPSKKVKPEGSVTISLAAYREMKEKRDKERQTIKGQQDDIRKQVSASGSEERKAGKPQAHIVNKKGSQNIKSSEDTSESLGNENSERKKSEIVSALLNELSDDEQNGQQSNDFIRKPGSLPHPRMPKDSLQSSTAFSTKRQDLVELSRPQTINSDDLVKSFNVNSKESSTKLVIKSHRDQRPANLDQKSTVNTCRISGSNKSSRTNKHAKIKISKKPHQHSVSQASQDKTLSSNRKSPHLETLPQASANTNAVSRQSENGANSDGCKSAKISTSVDLTVNPKHKHKHSEKEKSSKSVSEHQNTSISSPGLKMKIPKEKIKINPPIQDSSSKSSIQHREDLKIKIPKLKLGVGESSKSSIIPAESSGSSGSSLKLVISKERINSSTYSKSSSKLEKESRKRERSPKDSTLNKSPKQSKLECHATSSQKSGQSQEANSVSNMHPLGKQGYNQNASGHPGVSHGHHRIDGMGGMFQGKRMAQPRPPPPPQYMMNYGTPQGFPYTQYYPYPLHLPIPMANYHHQAFPQLFGNPPPPPPPQDPPLPREPPPPSPPPPPPPE